MDGQLARGAVAFLLGALVGAGVYAAYRGDLEDKGSSPPTGVSAPPVGSEAAAPAGETLDVAPQPRKPPETPTEKQATANATAEPAPKASDRGQRDPTLEERVLAVSRATDDPSAIMVIRLQHAKAEELANTLRRVVPSGVTVVADPPTNSLIISGPAPAAARPVVPE